jgi:cytochrome c
MSITLQKIAGAVLFALILVHGLGLLVNGVMRQPQDRPSLAVIASEGGFEPSKQAEAGAPQTAAAPEQPLPERLAAASAQKGQADAKICQSCHNFDPAQGAKIGPNLAGVVGRPKASAAGFDYSDALKKLGGDWTYEDLDKFLTKPAGDAPGTKMTFAGLPDPDKRAEVIAYLRSISPNAPPLPK